MKLSQYLSLKKLTDPEFALLVGLSKSQVGRLRRGLSRPTWETVDLIEKATGGKVKAADWAKDEGKAA